MMQSRRRFLGSVGIGMAMAAVGSNAGSAGSASGGAPKRPHPGAPRAGQIALPPGAVMPTRVLGRTGEAVSILGLGGYHIGVQADPQESVRIIRMAIDHGVTFLDNCWDYNHGESHRRMGAALQDGYRQRAFLMTKIDGRTREAAAGQIEQSLRDLRTDVIDLVQLHEVIRMSDPSRAFGPDGAIEALVAAQRAGKIRFIGFTGHKDPAIHLAMLRAAGEHGFTFDSVQMPINVLDAHYRSFQREVLPVAVRGGTGVVGMKPFCGGVACESPPLESRIVTPRECLQFAMSLPTSVVITGCETVGVLEQALDAAYRFRPMSPAERESLLARTAAAGAYGEWERFKTTDGFDGTSRHPGWLDTANL